MINGNLSLFSSFSPSLHDIPVSSVFSAPWPALRKPEILYRKVDPVQEEMYAKSQCNHGDVSRGFHAFHVSVPAILRHPPRFSFRAFKPSASVYSVPDDVLHAAHFAILLRELKRQTPAAK